MKYSVLIFIYLIVVSIKVGAVTTPSDSGSFQYVGNQTITFIDTERNNRNIQSLVYYPGTSEGNNAPINLSGGRYPVISFGHGFTLNPNIYIHLFRHLASWGYIVIAPVTETGFSPSHLEFAKDLVFVLKDMKRKNASTGDFFYNSADTNQTGVFGHSMGGGCSFLAGSLDPSIKAISSLAAASTNPSSITAINLIQKPVQLLSGARDSIASYWTNQLPHYSNANPYRQIINVKGGNHSYFHLLPGLDDLVDNLATITRPEQQRLTRRYVTSFFNLFLKNDTNYKSFLYGGIAQSDTSIIMQYELPTGTGFSNNESRLTDYKLEQNYPNPFNPSTRISFAVPKKGFVSLKVYDLLGKEITTLVNEVISAGEYRVNFSGDGLQSGVYFYLLETEGFTKSMKMLMVK